MDNSRKSASGKTSPEPSAVTKARTSTRSSKNSAASRNPAFLFLDLRHGGGGSDGPPQEKSWETGIPSHGELWMRNTGASPSVAVVSSLSSILEANVPEKYVLSEKACQGILRRCEERGKPLDPLLKSVLERQAGLSPTPLKSDPAVLGGGKGALIQTDLSATLATHNDQYLFQPLPPAFGFKAGQSPSAGGLGWEKEVAQTLGANMSGLEPTVCCYAVESHPMDSRVKLSEDGLVQTLAARMGTGGGGTRLSSSSAVPTTAVRGICPRRSECHPGDTPDIFHPQLGVGRNFRRVQFGWFVADPITGTLRTLEGRDPSIIILSPKGGDP